MRWSDIINLPVTTASGKSIGKVRDIDLDIDLHNVRQYVVHGGLLRDVYLIDPQQVLEITEDYMKVQDTVVAIPITDQLRRRYATPDTSSTTGR